MNERKWSRSEDWVGTEIDGSYVMINVESGKYVALNETAQAIWNSLETPQDERAIRDHILERFDVPADRCISAVGESLARMRKLSLVLEA